MTNNQQKAHDLFFQTELNQQQIADVIGVNRKTLYTWISEGKWIRAKAAASYAPLLLAEQYYAQLAAINNKIARREDPFATKEEADIIRKLTITVNTVRNEKRTCSETIELFSNFINRLKKKDNDLAKKVILHMDDYVKNMSEDGKFLNRGISPREEREFEHEYEQWLSSHLPGDMPAYTQSEQSLPVNTTNENEEQPVAKPVVANQGETTESRVCDRVSQNQEDQSKPLPVGTIRENNDENLSTITEKKEGVFPPPNNRRERRLQERLIKSNTIKTNRKQ